MSTRHHTGYGDDGHKTCAAAIAALDNELARLRGDDSVAPMGWSIEIDRIAEGHPRTRQQFPDLADRLVELLQARPELAWEVMRRSPVAGPWEELEGGDWARSSPTEPPGWYAHIYPTVAGAWCWRGITGTRRDAQAAADKELLARGVVLVGGAVVPE